MVSEILRDEINAVNGAVGAIKMFNNCISNGVSLAGVGYSVGAHRHATLDPTVPFKGTGIAVSLFFVGCVSSVIDDMVSAPEECVCVASTMNTRKPN